MTDRQVYLPRADHPLFTGDYTCPYCERGFKFGDAVVFHALDVADEDVRHARGVTYIRKGAETVPAVVMHEACKLALDGEQ